MLWRNIMIIYEIKIDSMKELDQNMPYLTSNNTRGENTPFQDLDKYLGSDPDNTPIKPMVKVLHENNICPSSKLGTNSKCISSIEKRNH